MGAGELFIVNSGPIIALQRAGVLPLLLQLPFDIRTTSYVLRELEDGVEVGHPPIDASKIPLIEVGGIVPPSLALELHAGEASVIHAAMQNQASVWIDERLGRSKALALELPVVGTLGMLARAKTVNLLVELRPVLEAMVAGGVWLSPKLVERFLESQGE